MLRSIPLPEGPKCHYSSENVYRLFKSNRHLTRNIQLWAVGIPGSDTRRRGIYLGRPSCSVTAWVSWGDLRGREGVGFNACFCHRGAGGAHTLVAVGHSFSLFTTLRDTDAERQIPPLVSQLSLYSPASASVSGGSTISPLPFLVKVSKTLREKTHTHTDTHIKEKRHFFRSGAYARRTVSAPLDQEHEGSPETFSREMWSFFPWHTSSSPGGVGLRSSAGTKHAT